MWGSSPLRLVSCISMIRPLLCLLRDPEVFLTGYPGRAREDGLGLHGFDLFFLALCMQTAFSPDLLHLLCTPPAYEDRFAWRAFLPLGWLENIVMRVLCPKINQGGCVYGFPKSRCSIGNGLECLRHWSDSGRPALANPLRDPRLSVSWVLVNFEMSAIPRIHSVATIPASFFDSP